MSWLMAAVYDGVMHAAETRCLAAWRSDLLRGVAGEVLEVGAGTGANLPHYPSSVARLVLAEPDRHMRRRLVSRQGRTGGPATGGAMPVEITDAGLPGLPMADASFDVIVGTLVFCSVRDPYAALADVFRVLRPGGRLVFLEHVAADEGSTRLAWQRRVEPVWTRVAGNCHLTRRTEGAIRAAGFAIERIHRDEMPKASPLVRATIRGVARKPAPGTAPCALPHAVAGHPSVS